MKVSVFIATSLDGYIARKDGDIDWLMSADTSGGTEDYGYQAFADSVDCLVMGRNCLEKVMSFPDWPYDGKRVIVLSTTIRDVPASLAGRIELYAGALTTLLERLQGEGCQRIYIDGGRTIQSFLQAGLVTDMTITTIPLLLGEGLPLFTESERTIALHHLSTDSYPSGFVQSRYELRQG